MFDLDLPKKRRISERAEKEHSRYEFRVQRAEERAGEYLDRIVGFNLGMRRRFPEYRGSVTVDDLVQSIGRSAMESSRSFIEELLYLYNWVEYEKPRV